MAKSTPLTEGAIRALTALREMSGPVTLNDLNAEVSEPVASAHLTALKRRGLVETAEVEVPVTRMQKVNTYVLTADGFSFSQE
jgi:DNA-binding transcriptional ArsR family regulator